MFLIKLCFWFLGLHFEDQQLIPSHWCSATDDQKVGFALPLHAALFKNNKTGKSKAHVEKNLQVGTKIRSGHIEYKCSSRHHKVQIPIGVSNIYVLDESNMKSHNIYRLLVMRSKVSCGVLPEVLGAHTWAGAISGPPWRFQQVWFVFKNETTTTTKGVWGVSAQPRDVNHKNDLFLIYEIHFFSYLLKSTTHHFPSLQHLSSCYATV